jgi:hypothetical protein
LGHNSGRADTSRLLDDIENLHAVDKMFNRHVIKIRPPC